MKSNGTPRSAPTRTLSWLALGAAVSLGGGIALSACISAGACEDDCTEAEGGSGGGEGGTSSGGKGGGGGGGNAPSAAPPSDLPVADCEGYETIDAVEKNILGKSCGLTGCHASMSASAPTTSLKPPGLAARLLDMAPKGTFCKDDKLIDPSDSSKSLLLSKLGEEPKCSDGSDGGEPMPGAPPISDDDKKCLEGYVKALADWANEQ